MGRLTDPLDADGGPDPLIWDAVAWPMIR